MRITFYKKDSANSYSIEPSQHYDKKESHLLIYNECGEGGQFNADEVTDVIYNALDKYFKENH